MFSHRITPSGWDWDWDWVRIRLKGISRDDLPQHPAQARSPRAQGVKFVARAAGDTQGAGSDAAGQEGRAARTAPEPPGSFPANGSPCGSGAVHAGPPLHWWTKSISGTAGFPLLRGAGVGMADIELLCRTAALPQHTASGKEGGEQHFERHSTAAGDAAAITLWVVLGGGEEPRPLLGTTQHCRVRLLPAASFALHFTGRRVKGSMLAARASLCTWTLLHLLLQMRPGANLWVEAAQQGTAPSALCPNTAQRAQFEGNLQKPHGRKPCHIPRGTPGYSPATAVSQPCTETAPCNHHWQPWEKHICFLPHLSARRAIPHAQTGRESRNTAPRHLLLALKMYSLSSGGFWQGGEITLRLEMFIS